MKTLARILVAILLLTQVESSLLLARPISPSIPSYKMDGRMYSRIIDTNQQAQSARNASITLEIGGPGNNLGLPYTGVTTCFNGSSYVPYTYVIALDSIFISMSPCVANSGNTIRNAGAFIIDPYIDYLTQSTPTQIASAMAAKGTLNGIPVYVPVYMANPVFNISASGRDVTFTRIAAETNPNGSNIAYLDSNGVSSNAFRVKSSVSGQMAVASRVESAEFIPVDPQTGEVFTMTINGVDYPYTVQTGDMPSDVVQGLVNAYQMNPLANISCQMNSTRVYCTGDTDTVSFTVTSSVTYPNPDTTGPLVTLVGPASMTLEYNDTFSDSGATWIDNRDGSGVILTATSGSVDTSTLGTYILEYTKTDLAGNASGVTRTVTVRDTQSPALSLIGNDPVTVEIENGYTDEGATWTDAHDGSGTVYGTLPDMTTLGSKSIIYTYVDASGNTGTTTRSLTVVDTIPPSLSLTTQNTTVDANIFPIKGTLSGNVQELSISGGVSRVRLQNPSRNFTAFVPLNQNSANTLYITATDVGGNTATGMLIITESGSVSGFTGAVSVSGSSLSGVTSYSGGSLTGVTQLVVEAPISFGGGSGAGIIPANTVITSSSGSTFDATAINSLNVTVTGGLSSNQTPNGALEFGISQVGLNFSKPVKIEIPVPGYTGSTILVKVKHGGSNSYVTTGLTNSPSATCSAGVASAPTDYATVSNFVATVYTCAASTFVTYTETPVVSSSSSRSSGGGGSNVLLASTPLVPVDSGAVLPLPVSNTEIIATFSVDTKSFRKSKTLVTKTSLKNGTRIIVSKVLSNGKTRVVGKARVLHGAIKYRIPSKGKYIFTLGK